MTACSSPCGQPFRIRPNEKGIGPKRLQLDARFCNSCSLSCRCRASAGVNSSVIGTSSCWLRLGHGRIIQIIFIIDSLMRRMLIDQKQAVLVLSDDIGAVQLADPVQLGKAVLLLLFLCFAAYYDNEAGRCAASASGTYAPRSGLDVRLRPTATSYLPRVFPNRKLFCVCCDGAKPRTGAYRRSAASFRDISSRSLPFCRILSISGCMKKIELNAVCFGYQLAGAAMIGRWPD